MAKKTIINISATILLFSLVACSTQTSMQANTPPSIPASSLEETTSTDMSSEVSSLENNLGVPDITQYIIDKQIIKIPLDIDEDGEVETVYYDPYRHGIITEKNGIEISFLNFSDGKISMSFNATGFGYIKKGYRIITDQNNWVYIGVFDGILHNDIEDIISRQWENIFQWNGEQWEWCDDVTFSQVENEDGIFYRNIQHGEQQISQIQDIQNLYTTVPNKIYFIPYA